MHDLTYAKEMIKAANDRIEKLAQGDEIVAINAALSPLSHVKPETLRETFATLVKDTPLEKIAINISVLKLSIKCETCQGDFKVDKPTFLCPKCYGKDLTILHSEEFQIESIDVNKKGSKTA